MAQDQREAMRQSLLAQTKYSYDHKDDSGQFKTVFIESPDFHLWKCKAGEHIIDIIPYIAGKNDPKHKVGTWKYVLILWIHFQVGVNQDAYICPARNYGKPCPICEYREELRKQDDYDEDLLKELTPKQRSIYNVIVLDSEKEMAKGIQVFDVAHWFMERYLAAMSKVPVRPGEARVDSYIPFSDPEEGKSISFNREGEGKTSNFIAHKFVDRSYVIPDEYINSTYQLDECIKLPTYDEIKEAFFGTTSDEIAPDEIQEIAPPPLKPMPRVPPTTIPTPTTKSAPIRKTLPLPAKQAEENLCPVEGVFGEDCEKLEACNGCPQWQGCSEAADILAANAQEEMAPPVPAPVKPVARPVMAKPMPTASVKPTVPIGPRRPIPIKKNRRCFMIQLGDRVVDKITGLKGIAIGETQWLYGCNRITIQPEEFKDGKPVDSFCVDREQLELVKAQVIIPKDKKEAEKKNPAGPRESSERQMDPKR